MKEPPWEVMAESLANVERIEVEVDELVVGDDEVELETLAEESQHQAIWKVELCQGIREDLYGQVEQTVMREKMFLPTEIVEVRKLGREMDMLLDIPVYEEKYQRVRGDAQLLFQQLFLAYHSSPLSVLVSFLA